MSKNPDLTKIAMLSVFVMFLALSGCGPKNEKAHPLFRKAEHCVNNGEYEDAVANYEKYLKVNPDSAKTHYKLAELYLDNIDDPFYAIYHFRQFLKLTPNSPDRDLIEKWIDSAEKKMVERINERDPSAVSKEEVEQLKEENAKYREYLMKLKKQNAQLRRKLTDSVVLDSGDEDIPQPLPESEELSGDTVSPNSMSLDDKLPEKKQVKDSSSIEQEQEILKIYKVKQGDSLSKISREVYGSSRYYHTIFEANRDTMPTEASLKIGQKLRIPKLKKRN